MANTYTPVNSDASAVAQRTITRLATVTGIAGLQNPVDLTTTTGGQLVAVADSYLGKFGFQAQGVHLNPAQTTSSTNFSNFCNSYSFSAQIAATYLLHVDVTIHATVLSSSECVTVFGYSLNGGADVSFQPGVIDCTAIGPYFNGSWRHSIACSAGANTIQLRWKVSSAAMTAAATASLAGRVITVTG